MTSENDVGVQVVTLDGEVDLAAMPTLMAALVADSAAPLIEVDMAGVTFMDSSGLRTLLQAKIALEEQGRNLTVVSCSAAVRRLLEITQTAGFLEVDAD